MRNWNLNGVLNWNIGIRLPDYLWGIETSTSPPWWSSFPLPDYLWGIETPRVDAKRDRNSGFQTTYEELKLAACNLFKPKCMPASRLPMRNWNYTNMESFNVRAVSFQTTYEELKLWTTSGTFPAFSFQTTYEELKPSSVNCLTIISMLPDYLWGIETGI